MRFNSKRAAQLILSVAGICSLSIPFAQTAQAREVRSLCNRYESTFAAGETKDFLVSICGGDLPHTYVGLDKHTGKTIRLPLTVDGSQNRGRHFEAVNGEYKYEVSINPRVSGNLIVKRNNRVILREAIVRQIY